MLSAQTPGPDVTATVSYETRTLGPDGVEKIARFSERLIRTSRHVWTQRIVPPGARHEAHADPHIHASDLSTASKHISLDDKGATQLSFVRSDLHTVIQTEPRDFNQLGFDGRFASARSLIDPQQIKSMKRMTRRSKVANATWYEAKQNRQFLRVLWSQPLELALEVESGTDDLSRFSRTWVVLEKPKRTAQPWDQLQSYAQRDYVDLLD